jgi:hypothetical protein
MQTGVLATRFSRRTQALSMLLDDGRLYFEKVFS